MRYDTFHANVASTGHFKHPKEIEHGLARVVYAESGTSLEGKHLLEGWVIPGGERTRDSNFARQVAMRMNEIMQTALPRAMALAMASKRSGL